MASRREESTVEATESESIPSERNLDLESSNVSDSTTEVKETATNEKDAAPKIKECPKFLDLAFAMDCTGSMGSYIHSAQQNIRKIVEQIVSEEKADVRLALVEYRDHPPQDSSFVTNVHDFTQSVRAMKGWLDTCKASGGGDQAEAVADALHQVLKLSWRDEATKVCVFIADAPPHGLGSGGDGFPNGCPDGLDPMDITNQLAAKKISLYMVGCEPSIVPFRDFFMSLSHLTGGQYVPLASSHLLAKVITGGVQEEISLQQLMEEVNQEVLTEFAAREDAVEEDDLTKRVHEKLKHRGARAKKLMRNNTDIPEASVRSQQMSECVDMKAARDMWSKAHPGSSSRGSDRSYRRSHKKSASTRAAPAAESSTGGLGAFFMNMLSFGRSSKSSSSSPAEASSDVPASEPLPPPRAMATESASATDIYGCSEDFISEAQVQRMVQRSVYSNNLKERYKKKY